MRKIQATKNYRMFIRSDCNRGTDLRKHRKLLESMKEYGFLPSFPIVCFRDTKGQLIVKDGQHRLVIAESLGLPVHWVEEPIDFDIATINCTAKTWQIADYARMYAKQGVVAYQDAIDFAELHKLPLGMAVSLLSGTTSWTNVQDAFHAGQFAVKDRAWADAVAGIYSPLVRMSSVVANARFLEACMAVCRVPEFDAKRLLHSVEKCRDKLVAYSTRDAYLDMIEQIYNYNRVKLFGLKVAAVMAMRERCAVQKSGESTVMPAASGHAASNGRSDPKQKKSSRNSAN